MIEAIRKDREELVKRICQSSGRETVFVLEDQLGKLDTLADLAEAWINEKLCDLRLLTDKRIELELQQCEQMLAIPNSRESYVKHWIAKRKNLLLLQKLVRAWSGDTLHNIQFAVSIQE